MTEVSLLSGHVDEEQLGHVPGPEGLLVFLYYGMWYAERFSNCGHLLLVLGSLLSTCLGVSNNGDELV